MSEHRSIPRQEAGDSASRRKAADRPTAGAEAAVVQWGPDSTASRLPGGRLLGRFSGDLRLAQLVAALGGLAASGSLLLAWSVTTLPGVTSVNGDPNEPVQMIGSVTDVGGLGAAYLVGLLGLAVCVALTFHGSTNVRHDARIAGITTAGVLLVVVVATVSMIDDEANRMFLPGEDVNIRAEVGQGLHLAFIGTALLGLALLLAGRHVRSAGVAAEPGAPATGGPATDQPADRTERPAPPEVDDYGPADLTVAPAQPFVLPDRRDPR